MGVWGNAGATFVIKAGEETICSGDTQGWWYEQASEEFTLTADTDITFEGATSNKPLDFVLITGTVGEGSSVAGVEAAETADKWYNLQGVQIAAPTQPGLYINNGKKVIVK